MNNFQFPIFNFQKKRGQAALVSVLFMLGILLSAVFGLSMLALKEKKVASTNTGTRYAFYVSEAGVEDAVYRIKNNKNLSSSYLLSLNNASSQINITTVSASEKRIDSTGDFSNGKRSISANIKTGTVGASFFYGVQVGDGGLEMGNNSQVNGSVFSNGNITGSSGAIISSDAIVAGGISDLPQFEWAVNDSDRFFATASGNRDIAQSFIAPTGGNLVRVAVYLGKVGNPTSNITLRITTDNGGKPNSSDITSSVIPYSGVGITPGWINVSFASPPNLTNGSKYWIVLDYGSNSASNYWNWRKDSSDAYVGNTGKYTSNWSSGSAVWTDVGGDLDFRVWIGGISTKIEGVTIGNSTTGTGRANQFINTTIHGSSCPNAYCIVDNPGREELPIPEGVIEDWRNDAASGGTCGPPTCDLSGNLSVTDESTIILGPKKITGNMTISNGTRLIITGTIWVVGTINLSNNCIVNLHSSYGSNSGIIMSDNNITVSNNCAFSGSGSPGSYVLVLSDRNAPTEDVLEVSNNSVGVIYYASRGKIELENNATAKEATGYGIDLSNNATINYESGLQNINFSSGPSGGWGINYWKEVVPQ